MPTASNPLPRRPASRSGRAPRRARRPSPAGGAVSALNTWCAERNGLLRLPLLVFLGWIWLRHTQDPLYQSVFKGLNLGIHELGHYLFGILGDIPGVLGGSLLQCLAPVVAGVLFARQRDWFAVAVAFGWLGTNFFDVAAYVGDAVAMDLPLVTPGGGHAIHDWNYVLGNFGWLRWADELAVAHRTAGHAAMLVCLAGGSWLVFRMLEAARRRHASGS